ncbi:DUF1853 family protein [Pseudomonas sp. SP16.1]|uniref:DUF1853 family protein n=1 Tax=Pseudomonas sp. SP16.1 TaxID=3458854 RepID=UPI0040459A16
MNPLDVLHELPRQLHSPAVRDLAWVLLSPPLLGQPPGPQRHPLQASRWRTQPALLADWLRQLDRDDGALNAWLAQPPVRRLGLYYERLWQFALHGAPDVEVLAANLPIRQSGRTLGELDLLLRDAEGEHHLELAVKFYLGPAAGDGEDAAQWLGPGSHDRLDLKLAHLRQHQLPLSSRREASSQLNELQVAGARAAFWLGGYLFYPWAQTCAAPRGASPQHLRGSWLHRHDWPAFLREQPPSVWQPLPRQAWLAPARVDAEQLWSGERLQQWLDALPAQAGAQLLVGLEEAADGSRQEVQRIFLVGDHWPGQAEPHALDCP